MAFQNSYTRSTGAPVTATDTFTLLNPATQYTLKAFNGGLENDVAELVSNSVVTLNGVQVLGPQNFNQGVLEVNVPISPLASNTITVQVRGKPGGVLALQIIGVDNDPPTITASLNPPPNAAGWNNTPVTVTFTCSDKTSGVASCPSPTTVSTETAGQVISGTATDLAGNTASTSVTVRLDMTPPTIAGTINPPPDTGGYNSTAVTVTFNCSDALSGIASCSSPVSITSEVTNYPVTGTATDVAGNTATTSVTVNISFNYFKIRSWQTNPSGDPLQTGKCLDYGASPLGNGASVFLNNCVVAHPIRVVEVSICVQDPNNPAGPPICSPRTGSGGTPLSHEVMLFAGKQVIGIHNPPVNSLGGGALPSPPSATEYALELQDPWNGPRVTFSNPANQIFRLDGDSIILEGAYQDPLTGNVIPGPCINTIATTSANICPAPLPQLVIEIQNARGINGSPIEVNARNLSDDEFWDFVAVDSSGKYPTHGFRSVATNVGLASAVSSASWGSVIVVTGNDPAECVGNSTVGPCIDLSLLAPLSLGAGVTLRGNRRGINLGPQLYLAQSGSSASTMLDVQGDYVRVTGLWLRGQSRATDESEPGTQGVRVEFPGSATGLLAFSPTTVTEFVAILDHNDASDWGALAFGASSPFIVTSGDPSICAYPGFVDSSGNQLSYTCGLTDPGTPTFNPGVPITPSGPRMPINDDPATLTNVLVARNFIHHNERNNLGYGVGAGRVIISGNTFLMNRHAITSDGEPHSEYRAANNLVLSSAPNYGGLSPYNQDFDMHGTNKGGIGGDGRGGPGGFYEDIFENTFLGTNRQNYWLRGFPSFETDFHRNVSLRTSQDDAIQFKHCATVSVCFGNPFPIHVFDQQFGWPDPVTGRGFASLGVGDFDGDGADDLFLATGSTWFYSPRGQAEWRFLNAAPDTIDQLLFGDFDGDGRTDVVAMRNGQLVISWGGISAFDVLNANPVPCTSMSDMAVGDFDGDGQPDIFCADGNTWWISYGGNTPFVQVIVADLTRVRDLRFGDFNGDGTTDVFGVVNGASTTPQWQVRYGPKGFQGALGGWQPLPVSLTSNPAGADGLVVADFDGNGVADVGMPCASGGVAGIGASPGWQISYGGAQGWSSCNAFADSLNGVNCTLITVGLAPSCITLVNGVVGRFSSGPGADILLWNYYNSQGGATLWDFPRGTGTPYQLSAPDVDAH